MEREIMSYDGNSQQSFTTLSLKPNGRIKTWVRPIESHPIQQSPGMTRPVEFIGEDFQNTTLLPDLWRWASIDPHLDARRNSKTTSFIHADPILTPPHVHD
jgi:hypothetical protein